MSHFGESNIFLENVFNFPPRNCPSVQTTELFVLKVCRNCYTLIASCLLCS